MMYYDNIEYARGRLKNCVINLEDGRPIYVLDIEGPDRVHVHHLVDEERSTVKIKDIDLTPVKLGWINIGESSLYAVRMPIRGVWKQGLCRDNIKFLSPFSGRAYCPIPSPSLGLTILGQYPTFEKVVKTVDKSTKCVAFSRNWALSASSLLYKGRIVGSHDRGSLLLNRQNEYLEDTLKEEVSESRGYC